MGKSINLILLDDCGRFAEEYHAVGFSHLSVIPLPTPDEISTQGLNDTIREQLAGFPDQTTVIAFTHTWIHPQEIETLVNQTTECSFLYRGESLVDVVIINGKPEIPEGDGRDFYDIIEGLHDVEYLEALSAVMMTGDDDNDSGLEAEVHADCLLDPVSFHYE